MGKFKKGDFVRSTDASTYGLIGEVIQVDDNDKDACVRFLGWHDGHGNEGQEWFVRFDELTLVSPEPAPLTIQPGKFYKTRDGRKVGPASTAGRQEPFAYRVSCNHYNKDGSHYYGDEHKDIISEWIDEPTDTTGYTVPLCAYEDVKAVGVSLHIGDGSSWAQIAGNQPAIVCLIENGQPLPSSRPHAHRNKTAASKEAERLAKKYPGKRFGVYEYVSHAEVEKPTYKHAWQRLAADGETVEARKTLQKTGLTGIQASRVVQEFVAAA